MQGATENIPATHLRPVDLEPITQGLLEFWNALESGRLWVARQRLDTNLGWLRAKHIAAHEAWKAAPRGLEKKHFKAMRDDLLVIKNMTSASIELMDIGKHRDAVLLFDAMKLAKAILDTAIYREERIARAGAADGGMGGMR